MTTSTSPHLRAALLVDFDNVYIGLQRLDPVAADAFATHPGVWLSALERGDDLDGELSRRFLVRAVYLNPSRFAQFRPNFTRAGFRVVDCPSLTQQGKSSADINLVLDAVDALQAPTRYDEFVIVSADADFTPLAQRFRAEDRRVTIVTASPAASAYRAVADFVVTADELAELVRPAEVAGGAAGAGAFEGGTGAAGPHGRRGDGADGPRGGAGAEGAEGTDDTDDTDAMDDTDGTGGPEGPDGLDEGVGGADPAGPEGSAPREGRRRRRRAGAPAGSPGVVTSPAAEAVRRMVRRAERPLNGGAVAQAAQQADPALSTSSWDGAGGFFPWLAREVPDVSADAGFVWDPRRFSEADLPGTVDLPPLQTQVVEVTDIPNLPTERYRVLLETLASDTAAVPFDRPETVRRVHTACQQAGEAIGRASVNAVVAGVLYAGLDLRAAPAAATVAATWADHVVGLCRGARMELSGQDVSALRAWVGGGLVTGASNGTGER